MSKILPLLVKTLGLLPLRYRSSIGAFLGWLYNLLPSRNHKIADLQIQMVLPEANYRKVRSEHYKNLGRTVMESIDLQEIQADPDSYVTCPNLHLLNELLDSPKPAIALTGHTGNWDLMAAYFIAKGLPLSTIGKRPRKQSFEATLAELRNSYGIKTIWRDRNSGPKEILDELRGNRVVAALIDQDTSVRTELSQFFGRTVRTPSGLLTLARRVNAKLFICFNIREDAGHFRLFLEEVVLGLDNSEILSLYHSSLERCIREAPEQWVWLHKRWRTDSEGKRLSSAEYERFLEAETA